ncbi:hypothetical protein KIN20_013220 [Parelaphostrongylus tenuis]|uniref:Uncharacterized protein n=1 Tax=Parelaphostrongylus tenuis TaxID=148309 RepID=A0AAD5MGB4_PARTN|nr:hypothetical protein KIN20_013220 [Parelaphostrongylus tenuis]
MMSEMEETLKLRQLNDEVAAAQERQRVLTIQVERERAEVERLRLLKQQNLDKGPVAADGNEISIHSNSGSFRDGSVKMVISPSPYHRSSIGSIYEEETVKISPVAEQQTKKRKLYLHY